MNYAPGYEPEQGLWDGMSPKPVLPRTRLVCPGNHQCATYDLYAYYCPVCGVLYLYAR